jgi:CHAT domain-containing protein
LLYVDFDYTHFSYSNFWGYKYIICRNIKPGDRPQEIKLPVIEVDDIINVGLLANKDLLYVSDVELPFLESLESKNLIKLFVPKRKLTGRTKNHLLANDLREFFGLETHIIHFACHTYQPKHKNEPNEEYCLLLSKDFKLWPSNFFPYSKLPFGDDPLIILNACGTSPHHPRSSWNMVKTLLENGAIGAIATEYNIPDIVAAFFIKLFYTYLLNEVPIGEAIFQARKTLLKAPYNNPFGLLYVLYANPQLRVKRMEKKHGRE